MTKHLSMMAALALTASACGGTYDEGSTGLDDEEVAEVSDALTNVDDCAITDVNADAYIYSPGQSESYTRSWQYIDNICPESNDTTYVDFTVNGSQVYKYYFVVNASWWAASNISQCVNRTLSTKVQRRVPGTSTFENVSSMVQHGVWNPATATCSGPQYTWFHNNSDGSGTETSMYRVKALATQHDGTHHATVQIIGANFGTP
ncbi:MAG: hypothetical protein WKG00_03720 [Polyangiaceae bacterium]